MRVFMMTLTMTAILGLTMAQPVLAGQGKISQDIAEACEGAINKDECVRELSENTQLQVMFGNKGYATKMCEHPCRELTGEYFERCTKACVAKMIN